MGERKVARLHIRAWAGILAAGLVTLFIMPPAPAGAAEAQLRVDAASRGGLTLTVYNRDLALISDRRSVDLPAGEARLVFEAVSPKLQADSLLVSGVGFRVLEQSFVFDLLSPRRLLETAVGKQVRVVKVHPQTGAETLVPARLLSVAEGVVLQIGERIETGEAGRLVFESVPEGLGAEPVLTALVASQVGGRRDLVLRYLTTGLSWQADYVAELSADEARLDLSALVTLTNASGLAYPAATLRLVAGEVRKERPPAVPRGRMVMAAEMSRGQGGDLQAQPAAADQHVYELGRPVNLADRETKQVALLSSRGVPVAKTYRFERLVNALGGPDEIGPAQATVELTFRNDAASGLDRPLPAGVMRVYQLGAEDAAPVFIGESRIGHTAAGQEVSLEIGKAFDVTGSARRTAFERLSNKSHESAQEIVIENAKAAAVEVEIAGTLPPGWRMVQESQTHVTESANRVVWTLDVPAGGAARLSYRVRISRP